MNNDTPPPDIETICVASRGRRGIDGVIMQHLELAPIANKTNCLTTVTKDNLLLQRPRGRKPGTIYIDKSPTLTQTAWEQNNLIMETPISQIIQVNPSTESNGKQPYQQNRVYSSEGKAPALMEGSGGRTINVTPPGGLHTHTKINPCRVRTVADYPGVVQMGSFGNTAIPYAG